MESVVEEASHSGSGKLESEMKDTGTFEGHVAPGLVFIVFGLLWTYNNLFHYQIARKEALLQGRDTRKLNYRSTLFSKFPDSSKYVLAEQYGTIAVGFCGLLGEMYSTFIVGVPFIMGIHHALMYFFFMFMALCAVVKHYKYEVPPGAVHAVFLVANAAVGYLFLIHRHSGLSLKMHLSISLFAFMTALCVGCEIVYRKSIIAALSRTLSCLAQGLWFCIMGFILYPLAFMSKWKAETHVKMDIATSLVAAVIVVVLLIAVVLNLIVCQRVKHLNLATINRIVVFSNDAKRSGSRGDCEKELISDSDDGN